MYWTEFLTVALIHLLAVASPGPDFAVVVRESVTHGRRAGMFTAFGVGTAIFVHVGYSLLGIGIIVSQSIVLFNALKWLAAAYLLYIGIKALRAKPADPAAVAQSLPVGERTARGAFTSGFVTNGLNPKATLFFLSLFTVVINPHTPLSIQAGLPTAAVPRSGWTKNRNGHSAPVACHLRCIWSASSNSWIRSAAIN